MSKKSRQRRERFKEHNPKDALVALCPSELETIVNFRASKLSEWFGNVHNAMELKQTILHAWTDSDFHNYTYGLSKAGFTDAEYYNNVIDSMTNAVGACLALTVTGTLAKAVPDFTFTRNAIRVLLLKCNLSNAYPEIMDALVNAVLHTLDNVSDSAVFIELMQGFRSPQGVFDLEDTDIHKCRSKQTQNGFFTLCMNGIYSSFMAYGNYLKTFVADERLKQWREENSDTAQPVVPVENELSSWEVGNNLIKDHTTSDFIRTTLSAIYAPTLVSRGSYNFDPADMSFLARANAGIGDTENYMVIQGSSDYASISLHLDSTLTKDIFDTTIDDLIERLKRDLILVHLHGAIPVNAIKWQSEECMMNLKCSTLLILVERGIESLVDFTWDNYQDYLKGENI